MNSEVQNDRYSIYLRPMSNKCLRINIFFTQFRRNIRGIIKFIININTIKEEKNEKKMYINKYIYKNSTYVNSTEKC